MAENEPKQLSLCYESENNTLQHCIAHIQNEFSEACKPPAWLTEAEYPMKWLMSLNFRLVLRPTSDIPEKLRDYKNQGAEYGFEKFCFILTMLVLKSQIFTGDSSDEDDDPPDNEKESDPDNLGTSESNNTKTSEEKPESHPSDDYSPEKAYALCREVLDEMASHEGDVMYARIGAALEYVLTATRAHMLFWEGDIATSQEVAKNLQPVAEMNIETRAGIEGIKGKFILSFYKDTSKALEASLKASEIDPTFGAWHYQTGKAIRRFRRENKEEMTVQEFKYFEKAVELERIPKYLVYLAQAYKEMAYCMFKNKETWEEINHMQKKAAELYRETWSLQNNAATVCRRIGNGMMKLKGESQDINLAKEAMYKSIEICENKSIIHQLGCLNYKFFEDDEAALQCFEKIKEIFCTGEIIRLKLIRDPSYDPVDEIEYWESICSKISKCDVLYCEIGWYYLFYKNILTTSVLYFWKVLKKNFETFRVTKFSSHAFCVYEPLNMIKVLVNEILLLKEKDVGPDQKEDITFLENFLQKVYEMHPEMCELIPDPNLKQRLKNTISRSITYFRIKRYGHSGNMTERRPRGNWKWQNNREPENSGNNWRRGEEPGSEQENNRFRGNMRNVNNEEPDRRNDESGVRRYNPNFGSNTFSDSGQDGSSRVSRRRFNSYNNTRNVDNEELDKGNDESGVRRNNPNFRSNMSSASGQDDSSRVNRRRFNSYNNTRNVDNEEPDRGNDESGMRRNNPNFRSNTSSASGQDGSNRGGNRRQFNGYNSNRYDVTVTDWRRENRNRDNQS